MRTIPTVRAIMSSKLYLAIIIVILMVGIVKLNDQVVTTRHLDERQHTETLRIERALLEKIKMLQRQIDAHIQAPHQK